MKKKFGFIVCLFIGMMGAAQDKDSIAIYISQGVKLHDKHAYKEAIAKYDKVLNIDPNHIAAIGEKAMSYSGLKEYEKAIELCKKAIKIDPNSKDLQFIYTCYANALDFTKKPKKALKIYNKGIQHFPTYHQLYFNKGITLLGLEKIDEALEAVEQSAIHNPNHASSYNFLGRIMGSKDQKIQALLALTRFFIIEPQGSRAEGNFTLINKITKGNVTKTGQNAITMNIDPDDLNSNKKKENDFKSTSLILAFSAALDHDEKNKDKSPVELFQSKLETVFSSLSELQKEGSGFYWEYYVPYFLELKENGHLEALAYIVHATSDTPEVKLWFDLSEAKLNKFYDWNDQYKWDIKSMK